MYDFGLTEAQFWKLTPAKFSALAERHEHTTRQSDLRSGMVCSVIANANGGKKGGGSFSPLDFVPSYEGEADVVTAEEAGEQSADDILKYLMAAFPPRPDVEADPEAEEHG